MDKVEYKVKHPLVEIIDPPREVCIIYIDRNNKEEYREYFGNNPRLEFPKDE